MRPAYHDATMPRAAPLVLRERLLFGSCGECRHFSNTNAAGARTISASNQGSTRQPASQLFEGARSGNAAKARQPDRPSSRHGPPQSEQARRRSRLRIKRHGRLQAPQRARTQRCYSTRGRCEKLNGWRSVNPRENGKWSQPVGRPRTTPREDRRAFFAGSL